ncbi:serine/threonine-protein kinase ppk18 isoform X2 [Rhodamnia argentea]|uniref:non-specific serine/threonine protein kinase n=1 Tax=Rhodamnia argentea TaxID=178133 RepID=A0A8B8NRH4_9MYRT|nr:serine/threonine-protein kinase ppk18 isoform X2 [Rhodamnia argentea]
MSTHPTGSQLATTAPTSPSCSSDSEKAWHLLSLLLSLGRPSSPLELASKCELFPTSPDLIRHLCDVPSSPIHLTDDLFVTLSFATLISLAQFLTNSNLVSFFCSPRVERPCFRKRKGSILECESLPPVKRRANSESYVDEKVYPDIRKGRSCCPFLCLPGGNQDGCRKVHLRINKDKVWTINIEQSKVSDMRSNLITTPWLFVNATRRQLGRPPNDTGHKGQDDTLMSFAREKAQKDVVMLNYPNCSCKAEEISDISKIETSRNVVPPIPYLVPNVSHRALGNPFVCIETTADKIDSTENEDFSQAFCEGVNQEKMLLNEAENTDHALEGTSTPTNNERNMADGQKEVSASSVRLIRDIEETNMAFDAAPLDRPFETEFKWKSEVNCLDKRRSIRSKPSLPEVELSGMQNLLSKPSAKMKTSHKDAGSPSMQALSKSLEHRKAVQTSKEKEQVKRGQKLINLKKQAKNGQIGMCYQERKGTSTSVSLKVQLGTKILPDFESYIVEEEEGSGGYGTVYRARRKDDGSTVAIKCPHPKVHQHHINNELKMLEKFGGKNCVIKYEGSFKNENSDCFILEYVEHDRPEVLKKEIDVLQLQWYGYCLFRALASLHKQGIVHRDVKPGNFLYSSKANKGYLIDFNLAMDLHQKYGSKNKLKLGNKHMEDFHPPTFQNAKSLTPTKSGKSTRAKSLSTLKLALEEVKGSKSPVDPKNLKRKVVDQKKYYLASCHTIRSQGPDGSGITSTKDLTSASTPSAKRLREPLPRHGRKELISLLHDGMHMNHEASSVPATLRKRVAAPPSKSEGKLRIISPMPLHSRGVAVSGAGLRSDHGKEGPCVGTKGFRAPEVLLKSPHQGTKLDIWSAGVTLLYLVIGTSPFLGDPEQNIKEIAKLRGSEDLWEVAKLHDRELSFPVDLYDTQSLASLNLRDWCQKNTKRPNFLEVLPQSLFDLVDRCLTVNPRARISAEEALRHEFFAPCHDELRKQKLHRLGSTKIRE